jgi:flagellar biosynthesis protein FlhA
LSTYAIRISGVDAGTGQAPPGTVLAIGDGLQALPGRAGVEPVFGLAGKWVPAELHYQAELSGATVVDRASVIITHLAEIVRNNASRLLGREDVRALTEMVKTTHPVVVEELTPSLLSLGQIQRVLQGLLDESVPIRDLVRIFEALSLRAKLSVDHDGLVEAARAALGPAIAAQYAANGTLTVLTLDPQLEQSLLESLRPSETGAFMAIDGLRAEAVVGEAARLVEAAEQQGVTPVLACSPQLRLPLMRLLRAGSRRVQVLSYSEISGSTAQIETMGVVNGAYAGAA